MITIPTTSIQYTDLEASGVRVASKVPPKYKDVGQCWSILAKTSKAVLLGVPNGITNWHDKEVWVPKSQMAIVVDPLFESLAVATWVIAKNNLWNSL